MGIIERAAARLPQQPAKGVGSRPSQQASSPVGTLIDLPRQDSTAGAPSAAKRIELNLSKLQQAGMVTPELGRSAIAEEFRAIKRTLLLQAFEPSKKPGCPNNLIMVTSSMPGEGKTFCAINLAMSIAMERDHTVVLVDADVARPTVMQCLGVSSEGGLMDVLLDPAIDLGDVLLNTNVEKLRLLPAGARHRHATEILASQAMSRLLNELATRYADRIVIFDSPPLLPTSEARVLAQQMGQIVMVVEAERTSQRNLANSLRHLDGCPNVGLVYNKARDFAGDEAYGYYYQD